MLKDRQKIILGAVVEEYFRTAKPVSSREIVNDFGLKMSPATIRNEMLCLDERGFLEQPHTSAGRIPTDKGYRFFVDNLSEELELNSEEMRLVGKSLALKEEEEFVREFSRTLSHLSETFAAVGILKDRFFYESGLKEVLQEPEFRDANYLESFGEFVDFLDEEIRNVFPSLKKEIFIGQENPINKAKNITMTVSKIERPSGHSGYFVLLGPKRTDYRRHKAIIKSVKKIQDGGR